MDLKLQICPFNISKLIICVPTSYQQDSISILFWLGRREIGAFTDSGSGGAHSILVVWNEARYLDVLILTTAIACGPGGTHLMIAPSLTISGFVVTFAEPILVKICCGGAP